MSGRRLETSWNPFGFTGHEVDDETGLIYARARFYDPDVGRFLSEDPFEGEVMQPPSLHRYLYAYQNPTVWTDPNGREATPAELAVDVARVPELEGQLKEAEEAAMEAMRGGAERDHPALQQYRSLLSELQATRKRVTENTEFLRGVYGLLQEDSDGPGAGLAEEELHYRQSIVLRGLLGEEYGIYGARANELVGGILGPTPGCDQYCQFHSAFEGMADAVPAMEKIIASVALGYIFSAEGVFSLLDDFAGLASASAREGRLASAVEALPGQRLLGGADPPFPGLAKAEPLLLEAPKTVRHHIFNKFRGKSPASQKYRDFFQRHGIDVDDFTVEIPEAMHREWVHRAGHNWTTRWKRWIDANPNATSKDVYQQAGRMMDEYGLSGEPLIRYR